MGTLMYCSSMSSSSPPSVAEPSGVEAGAGAPGLATGEPGGGAGGAGWTGLEAPTGAGGVGEGDKGRAALPATPRFTGSLGLTGVMGRIVFGFWPGLGCCGIWASSMEPRRDAGAGAGVPGAAG